MKKLITLNKEQQKILEDVATNIRRYGFGGIYGKRNAIHPSTDLEPFRISQKRLDSDKPSK